MFVIKKLAASSMQHEAKIAYYAFDVIRFFVPYAACLKLLGFYYFFVCTLIRHVLLIRSRHTELLIRSGYAAILFASSIGGSCQGNVTSLPLTLYRSRSCVDVLRGEHADVTDFFSFLVTLVDEVRGQA